MDWLSFHASGTFSYPRGVTSANFKYRIEDFTAEPVRIHWGIAPIKPPSLALLPVLRVIADVATYLNVRVVIVIADLHAKLMTGTAVTEERIMQYEKFIARWLGVVALSDRVIIMRGSILANECGYMGAVVDISVTASSGVCIADIMQIADERILRTDIQIGYPDQTDVFKLSRELGGKTAHMIIGWTGEFDGMGIKSNYRVITIMEKMHVELSADKIRGIIRKMTVAEIAELFRLIPVIASSTRQVIEVGHPERDPHIILENRLLVFLG